MTAQGRSSHGRAYSPGVCLISVYLMSMHLIGVLVGYSDGFNISLIKCRVNGLIKYKTRHIIIPVLAVLADEDEEDTTFVRPAHTEEATARIRQPCRGFTGRIGVDSEELVEHFITVRFLLDFYWEKRVLNVLVSMQNGHCFESHSNDVSCPFRSRRGSDTEIPFRSSTRPPFCYTSTAIHHTHSFSAISVKQHFKQRNGQIPTTMTMPHVAHLANSSISKLASFSGRLIISIIFVLYFLIRFYILEGCLLRWLYGEKYIKLSETDRRGFVNHHIAGATKILILVIAHIPLSMSRLGVRHCIALSGVVHTLLRAIFSLSRPKCSLLCMSLSYLQAEDLACTSIAHHIGTIMIGQSAIAISLDLVRERDATIEFVLCTVWGELLSMLFIFAFFTTNN